MKRRPNGAHPHTIHLAAQSYGVFLAVPAPWRQTRFLALDFAGAFKKELQNNQRACRMVVYDSFKNDREITDSYWGDNLQYNINASESKIPITYNCDPRKRAKQNRQSVLQRLVATACFE